MPTYNRARAEFLRGNIDLVNETIRAILVTDEYVYDPDDNFLDEGGGSDPVDAEITGVTNYSRIELTSNTVTEDGGSDAGFFDADDSEFVELGNGSNEDVAAAILFRVGVSGDADALLLAYIDIGDFTTNGESVTFVWSPSGILRVS